MNTQEIKEYEYQILMSVNNNFDTKLKEAEVEGWERIGDVLLSKGGAYNQDTIAQIPMRKPIGNKREKPVKDEEPKITVKVIDNPVEKEEVKEMFVNVFNNGHKNYVGMNIHDSIDNCHESIGLSCDTKHLGIFKLVKVK